MQWVCLKCFMECACHLFVFFLCLCVLILSLKKTMVKDSILFWNMHGYISKLCKDDNSWVEKGSLNEVLENTNILHSFVRLFSSLSILFHQSLMLFPIINPIEMQTDISLHLQLRLKKLKKMFCSERFWMSPSHSIFGIASHLLSFQSHRALLPGLLTTLVSDALMCCESI